MSKEGKLQKRMNTYPVVTKEMLSDIEEAKKDERLKAVSFVISGYPHKKIVPL